MSGTLRIEGSADGKHWVELPDFAEPGPGPIIPLRIVIAKGMMGAFGQWLESGGVRRVEVERPEIRGIGGLPVEENVFLLGKHGVTLMSDGCGVPFFWGERDGERPGSKPFLDDAPE